MLVTVILMTAPHMAVAQTAGQASDSNGTVRNWTLKECLDYATENNITLQLKQNNYLSGQEDTKQARAALFPSLSFGSNQGLTLRNTGESTSTFSGSYSLNADVTLYNGGRNRMNIEQNEIQNQIDSLDILSNTNSIHISIIQAYMQCLYAQEAIQVNENSLELAIAQRDRAKELKNAGLISKVDYAQLESQVSNSQYQLTVSQNTLSNYKLQLKQLLELGMNEDLLLKESDADEDNVLRILPSKQVVYENALANMPEMLSSDLNVKSAELSEKSARAGFMPTIGMNLGVGTSNIYGSETGIGQQLSDNLNSSVGMSLTVPIISGRSNRTQVNKAKYATMNSRLNRANTEKNILKEVESTYLDAVASQSQYVAAKEQVGYAQQSYDLTNEQFSLGMKNTIEVIEAKNELISSQQSCLQAKYMTLLSMEILDIYQGINK